MRSQMEDVVKSLGEHAHSSDAQSDNQENISKRNIMYVISRPSTVAQYTWSALYTLTLQL